MTEKKSSVVLKTGIKIVLGLFLGEIECLLFVKTNAVSAMFPFLRCDLGEGMENPVHRGETMPIGLHDR